MRSTTLSLTALFFLCATSSSVHAVTPSNLIGHWKFDENSGLVANDSSSANIHANYRNATGAGLTWSAGKIGGSATLDGADVSDNDFVINDLFTLNGATEFTISGWFSADDQDYTSQNYKGIFMSRTVVDSSGSDKWNYGIALQDNDVNQVSHVDSRLHNAALDSSISPETIMTQQWYHVAMVFNGTNHTHRLFVDGTEVSGSPTGHFFVDIDSITTGGSWYFGVDPLGFDPDSADPRGPLRHFAGSLDDWTLWNTALDSADISTIHQGGLRGVDGFRSLFVPEPTSTTLLTIGLSAIALYASRLKSGVKNP